MSDNGQLRSTLQAIYRRQRPPELRSFSRVIGRASAVLSREPVDSRPAAPSGYPGGLVYLYPELPTLIVPDLHARMPLVLALLGYKPGGLDVLALLGEKQIQVVAVGDGVHAEGRAMRRWLAAFDEFQGGYRQHRAIDAELRESFGTMEMVMELKCAFPRYFHFLKGNHDNITNEEGEGNLPFGKFVAEGEMVERYVRKFYGPELLNSYSRLEKQLPLLAAGRGFLISHAEPRAIFPATHIIDYRRHPEVVAGLTWTDNGAAVDGSVVGMLDALLGDERSGAVDDRYYFGGHRPVSGRWGERAGGSYIQLHNPERMQVAFVPNDRPFEPERDIVRLD